MGRRERMTRRKRRDGNDRHLTLLQRYLCCTCTRLFLLGEVEETNFEPKKKKKICVIIDYFLGLLGPFLYFLIFGGKSFFVGKSDHYSRKSNEQTEVRTELFWFCLKQEATRQQRCLFYDRTDGDTTWTGSGEASGCEGW